MPISELVTYFREGLRKDSRANANTAHLERCYGQKASEFGVVNSTTVTAFDATSVSWPFPQVLKGSIHTLLVETDAISVWNGSAFIDITTYQVDDMTVSVAVSIAATDPPFHLVDYGEVWFLTNSIVMFYCTPVNTATGATSPLQWKVSQVPASVMKWGAIASHLGRLYISGFNSANAHYATSAWTELFELWIEQNQDQATYEEMAIDNNVLFYSRDRGGDIWWPLAVELAAFGLPSSTQGTESTEFYTDAIRDGHMGFIKLPFQAGCSRILSLGQAIICYSTDGIVAVVPIESGGRQEHIVRKLSDVGTLSKGAVIEGRDFHAFVDGAGRMWILTADLQLRKLDYSEWLVDIHDNKNTAVPIMTYEPVQSDIMIANGTVGFVRSRTGLGELWELPTSLVLDVGDVKGYIVDAAPQDGLARVLTGEFDLGNRMHKFLYGLEIGDIGVTNLRMRLHYRMQDTTWRQSSWLPRIHGGFHVQKVMATSFKIELEFTPSDETRIEYIKVNWQVRDHRNFRARQPGEF